MQQLERGVVCPMQKPLPCHRQPCNSVRRAPAGINALTVKPNSPERPRKWLAWRQGDVGAAGARAGQSKTRKPYEAIAADLRATVNTCLNSRLPILIWWGPETDRNLQRARISTGSGKQAPALFGTARRRVLAWGLACRSGPMLKASSPEGKASWSRKPALQRKSGVMGFLEESPVTFSSSPIRSSSEASAACRPPRSHGDHHASISERRLRHAEARLRIRAQTAKDRRP